MHIVRIIRSSALLLLCALSASAATPGQASIQYSGLTSGSATAFAIDSAGNRFIVGKIVKPSGLPQIRVLKLDQNGNRLASLDFGGSATAPDYISAAAVDPKGNLVLAGGTASADFPLVAPLFPKSGVSPEFLFNYMAVIVKIDSQLKNILFSSWLSENSGTSAGALALDSSGNIYIAGATGDSRFPVTSNGFQRQPPKLGAVYSFLTKIGADTKSILFSTYFGDDATSCSDTTYCTPDTANGTTYASAIALDATGNIVIAGRTSATKLPVSPGVFGQLCGECGVPPEGLAGFVAKFSPDGSKIVWATYIPVKRNSTLFAQVGIDLIGLDSAGNVIVGGSATPGLPVTKGALQSGIADPSLSAGFLLKLDPAAQRLIFATYFGSDDRTFGNSGVSGIVTDAQDGIWISGESSSTNIPKPAGTEILGTSYVAHLSPDGSNVDSLFTAPRGATGLPLLHSADGGIATMGQAGVILNVADTQGPSVTAITNSAGSSVPGGFAPFEFISIFGPGIGPQTSTTAPIAYGALPASLSGVQVLFDGAPCPLLFAGPNQINAIVPQSVYRKERAVLRIVTPSGTLKSLLVPIQFAQPEVFLSGGAQVFQAFPANARNEDGSTNSPTNPAALGSTVTILATGTGMPDNRPSDGTIVDFPGGPTLAVSIFPVQIGYFGYYIGGLLPGPLSLEVINARDVAGMAPGVTEIKFRLPSQNSENRAFMAFTLQIGEYSSSTFVVHTRL